MELMSLLLCAVVAFSPRASGERDIKYAVYGSTRSNSSLDFRRNPTLKNIILDIGKRRDLQNVFTDVTCKDCIGCIERTMKAVKPNAPIFNNNPSTEKFHDDISISNNEVVPRYKRESDLVDDTKPEDFTIKPKKTKSKKSKLNKFVTVTKYNVDGEITALKVKEISLQAVDQISDIQSLTTCQVYKVQKYYPCDSPESDVILAASRRKTKKSRKEKDKNKVATSTPTPVAPAFRKREVDNTQVPENFMSSIEELY